MGFRVKNDQDSAFALLEQAQPVAEAHGLDELLGRIAELRGNLYFMTGEMERCLREHRTALDCARRISSVDLEARALGGLADAHYAAGRMVTAYEHGEACLALANQQGLGRIAVAYQGMLGLMKFFLIDVRDAQRLSKEAIITAQHLGHERAEVMARLISAYALSELGVYREALLVLDPCTDLIEKLGLEMFKPEIPQQRSEALLSMGQRKEAARELFDGARIARQTRPAYTLAAVLGRLAYATDDAGQREAALREGSEMLDSGSLSHNHFDFYRYAIETMLQIGAWDRVEDFAVRLEAYPPGETVPWSRYFAARGRALAAFGAGKQDEPVVAQLRALHAEAEDCGLLAALPRLEEAINSFYRK